jgi:hypothetical protein
MPSVGLLVFKPTGTKHVNAVAMLFFILGPVIAQPVADNFERCYQNLEHDCYYVLKEKYVGIEEFEFFWIDEIDRPKLFVRGAVYVDKTFHRFDGTVKGNRISFVLLLRGGITYKFSGAFRPGGRWDGEGRMAIDGRLIKLNAIKKIKAMNVKLFVGHGSNQ